LAGAMAEESRTLMNRRGFDGLSRLHPTLRRYDEVWRPTGWRSAPASPTRGRSMQCAPRPWRWEVEFSERTEGLGPGAGRLLMAVVLAQPLRRGWHGWRTMVRHRAKRRRKVLQLLAPRLDRRKARALARWRVASGHTVAGWKTGHGARQHALGLRLDHAIVGPEKLTQAVAVVVSGAVVSSAMLTEHRAQAAAPHTYRRCCTRAAWRAYAAGAAGSAPPASTPAPPPPPRSSRCARRGAPSPPPSASTARCAPRRARTGRAPRRQSCSRLTTPPPPQHLQRRRTTRE